MVATAIQMGIVSNVEELELLTPGELNTFCASDMPMFKPEIRPLEAAETTEHNTRKSASNSGFTAKARLAKERKKKNNARRNAANVRVKTCMI